MRTQTSTVVPGAPGPARRRETRARTCALLLAAFIGLPLLALPTALAAFGSSTLSSAAFSAAASFATYADVVLADNPRLFYRMQESTSAASLSDASPNGRDAPIPTPPVLWGQASSPAVTSGYAASFSGLGELGSTTSLTFAAQLSLEVWIKTSTTSGGWIVGRGDDPHAPKIASYDRIIYMLADGRLVFGVANGAAQTVASTAAYNDGGWHHIVATLGSGGMRLYADGVAAATPDTTVTGSTDPASGYLRVGGGSLASWPSSPPSAFFTGFVDEVAVYSTQLSAGRVSTHYSSRGSGYRAAVSADNPTLQWRLDNTANPAPDSAGTHPGDDGRLATGVTSPLTGSLNLPDSAIGLRSAANVFADPTSMAAPNTFTEELWLRTTTSTGGRLMGLSSLTSGSSAAYDRHLYMLDSGQVAFGVNPGPPSIITSPASLNDGGWHHVVATLGTAGMRLYVDGSLVATNASVTTGESFATAYVRIGWDQLEGWPSRPTSDDFTGDIDEVAFYNTQLSAARVAAHWGQRGN